MKQPSKGKIQTDDKTMKNVQEHNSHQRNANQDHTENLSYPSPNGNCYKNK